jgi:hypothetical protein
MDPSMSVSRAASLVGLLNTEKNRLQVSLNPFFIHTTTYDGIFI